ncbi:MULTISPECIES: hypothetical protein [unclassified Pseudomonas]|uniref:hypothetical protein n=1 Tax=unclassified Pseudomonas TaxID=196821 RepID=UPI00069E5D15|nr:MULTISPECIES: hypothetical protein [unclassified Pseudomonas]MBY8944547.1 hypothetical protein [Pseudomonas sp. SH10-3B]
MIIGSLIQGITNIGHRADGYMKSKSKTPDEIEAEYIQKKTIRDTLDNAWTSSRVSHLKGLIASSKAQ